MPRSNYRIVFFGTPKFSTMVLDELEATGMVPTLMVTAPDKPVGRGMVLTPPPVKTWAVKHGIDVIQPETLTEVPEELLNTEWDLFIVAAYGKILRKQILDLPHHGTLNVHPSLLPRLRGASPIISAIVTDERETGVSIMLLDEEMDHGPLVAQASVTIEEDPQAGGWPVRASVLEALLAHEGGKLLAEVIPDWMEGKITPSAQDHAKATFTKKIIKEDGLIDLSGDPYENYKKIQAFDEWPGTYFFVDPPAGGMGKKIRVKIADATFQDGKLTITRVIPEGKREMNYQDFIRV